MKYFYLTFLLILSTFSFAQTTNVCKDLIQGKYTQENNSEDGYIEFQDDFLYEIKGKEYIKSKIVWNDECSYTLKLIDTNIKGIVIPKGAELNVSILSANENEFIITYDFMQDGIAKPIKMIRYDL